MKNILFFFCIGLGFLASAQEKKKDSVIFEYKPRLFYPSDCSCPGKVIYKEVKPGDKNFNPYNYKEIRPIRIESFNDDDKKKILELIYRKV